MCARCDVGLAQRQPAIVAGHEPWQQHAEAARHERHDGALSEQCIAEHAARQHDRLAAKTLANAFAAKHDEGAEGAVKGAGDVGSRAPAREVGDNTLDDVRGVARPARSTDENGYGKVLSDEIVRCRQSRDQMLNGVAAIGGTLCNDGAKWRRRSLINSALMTSVGPFFCQSTDATGKFKGAQYLLDDIKSAISTIGAENVFIVALDGACKATLSMIHADRGMHQIFPQRCTTHGCNLLVADVGKLFQWEILLCVRLVKFVSNHDGILAILMAMPQALLLLGAVETRFASQIYSSERILHDKDFLKDLFNGRELREYLARYPAQAIEHRSLDDDFISNAATWERIKIFVDVELPLRQLLRISDGHKLNLADIAYGFEDASKKMQLPQLRESTPTNIWIYP